MEKATCKRIVLVLVVLSLISDYGAATAVGRKTPTDLETMRELKRINKPAIKTIKSEDGDIIDCVDIYKQPAFDHPLLKNHTIQMRPSNYGNQKVSSSRTSKQLWHKSGSCPKGAIPILRTQKSDLTSNISLEGFGLNAFTPQMESAKIRVEDRVQGGEAVINVWNIHVEPGESSTTSIFVGKKQSSEFVNSGWIVSRDIYNDDATRFYGFWASDNKGCYNLKCPGFVQISQDFVLGAAITSGSTYGGNQIGFNLKIFKDQGNSNWWLVFNNETVGYWPGSLFGNMAEYADFIEWGGQVYNTAPGGKHTSTQMGSGHFPKEGYGKAAYFDNCLKFHEKLAKVTPSIEEVDYKISKASCYDVSNELDNKDVPGIAFYYGGPGGLNCD